MTKLFLGGVPTAPDVKKLRKAFPEIEEGTDFTHDEVGAVIGLQPNSSRYRCITTAWRKEMLNEFNIEIAAISGIGFRALTGPERLDTNVKGFKQGTRKQGKSIRRVTMVRAETLNELEQSRQLHVMRLGAAVLSQASSMMKEIEPPKLKQQVSTQRPPPSDPRLNG